MSTDRTRAPSSAPVLDALLRRRTSFGLVALVCFVAVVAVTLYLPRQYDATATLFVGERESSEQSLAFDTNVGEQLSRTYTTLAAQPGVADAVRAQLHPSMSRTELFSRMTFTPVERTQLLQITARARTPQAATTIANTYAQTFADRVENKFSQGNAPTRVTIAERAAAPTKAATPNVPLYLGFGLVISLILAGGAALLRDRLDDRLRISPDDLAVLEHPVLARIPDFGGRGPADPVATDAFRLLRANIDFSSETPPRSIGVTSAAPLDGKSTVASQLALAAAAAGERVVLVEADLRRPGLRNTTVAEGWEPARLGLTQYLSHVETLGAVLTQHPSVEGLWVIWPGAPAPNPTRLLASPRFEQMLEELAMHFDRVIVDTSPIAVGADASMVLARLDATVFVVNTERTSRSGAQNGIAQLETSRATLVGVVLNRDERSRMREYAYYAGTNGAGSTTEQAAAGSGRRRLLR